MRGKLLRMTVFLALLLLFLRGGAETVQAREAEPESIQTG